jgi:hypothetical protein
MKLIKIFSFFRMDRDWSVLDDLGGGGKKEKFQCFVMPARK